MKKLQVSLATLLVFITVSAVAVWVYSTTFSTAWKTKSIAIGDDIIVALDTYKEKNGRYPTTLKNLEPEYKKSIVNPVDGYWLYVSYDDGVNFSLVYQGARAFFRTIAYNSEVGAWYEEEY